MLSASLHQQAQHIAELYTPPETGRPSAIGNAAAMTELLEQIAEGASREAACQVAGVSLRTLQRIIERGDAGEDPERAFVALLKRAEGLVEARVTKNVLRASELPQFWAAGMTYLERRHPERWGRRNEGSNEPRVVVQIGVKDSDVQVTIAQQSACITDLSPDSPQHLAPLSTGQVDIQRPIIGHSVNDNAAQPTDPPATSGARSAEGPSPARPRVSRGRRAGAKSALAGGKEKKA